MIMRNEVFVYLEIYTVYLEIYEYGKVVQGVRFPDGLGESLIWKVALYDIIDRPARIPPCQ